MSTLTDRILDLAKRVADNVPAHRDPERFHEEKSEIVRELKKVSREIAVEDR